MKARSALTAFPLFITLTTGCSMVHSDPHNPAKNPHPVKRYEVIATSHAPGPWDSIEGYIYYDIINTKCVPMKPFVGEQDVPDTRVDISMIRVDDHTWKGYFYRDAFQDEDYYKLGVCHWDATNAGVSAMRQGVRFNWVGMLDELLRGSTERRYFKKSVYGDLSFVPYGAPDLDPADDEVLQHPDAYFPVTIAVKEAMP